MTVAAIIPAYNEEETITHVVETVGSHPQVDEIIVVSDGSTDQTASIAQKSGARVIELEENCGKGDAIRAGVQGASAADVFLLLDADLLGLNHEHIARLLGPVLDGETDMTVGIFEKGRLATDLAHRIAPFLSGQRALRSEILREFFELGSSEYGVETFLTRFFKKKGYRYREITLKDMTHVMKEEKLGLLSGFLQRLKMFWQVAKSMVRRV